MIRLLKNEFDSAYKILDSSFPNDEIRPYNEQKNLLDNSLYKLYGLYEKEEITAVMAVWEFEEFVFIEHLAVSVEFRNKNIGSRFLKDVLSSTDKMICLEVEPPEDELKKRRIAFYERNGFFLNEYPYIQPPISKGRNPVPLMIMTSEGKISDNEFLKIKDCLYNNVYNVKKPL